MPIEPTLRRATSAKTWAKCVLPYRFHERASQLLWSHLSNRQLVARSTDATELPVANAVSGNYCQPRCDEPTTEVKFGSASAGNVQSQLPTLMGRTSAENPSSCSGRIIIAPITKLTRLQTPTIDQVRKLLTLNVAQSGNPTELHTQLRWLSPIGMCVLLAQIGDLSGVINSIGPYITGDFIDPEDVTDMKEIIDNGRKFSFSRVCVGFCCFAGGVQYYVYELNTPYALSGTHNLELIGRLYLPIASSLKSAH
eukprot:1194497-Prorocentrum_minimum.AAC.7